MSIEIRKVLVEEAREYAICHATCWRAAYKGIIPDEYLNNMLSDMDQVVEIRKQSISEASGDEYCCITLDGKMIGKLGYSKCRDEDKIDAGEIHAIYLYPDYWDKGYGRQIMEYTLDKLKAMGFGEVVIWVLEENMRARMFYEKFGFKFDGTAKEIIIGKPLIEFRYVLELDEQMQ